MRYLFPGRVVRRIKPRPIVFLPALLLFLSAIPAPSHAQSLTGNAADILAPETRLRLTVSDPKLTPYLLRSIKWAKVKRLPGQTFVFQGEVRSLQDEIMVFKDESVFTTLRLPLRSVRKVEISRGRRFWQNTADGARFGLYLGTIGMTFLFFVRSVTFGGVEFDWGEYALFLAGGSVVGTFGGAVVGTFIRSDKWEAIVPPWEVGH